MNRAWVGRHQLAVFFVLAYAISWAAQIPGYLFVRREGLVLSNEANTAHLLDLFAGDIHPGLTPYLLLYAFAFGPTVAGIAVTAVVARRPGPYLLGQVHLGLLLPILAGLTVGIVGWTIVMTWIYNHTHSVFWIIVLHGWYNTVQSYLILSSEHLAAQAIFPLQPWVVALVLLRRYGSATLTRAATGVVAH